MEFPASAEVYAERRRLRMEKVKNLRFSKSMPPSNIPSNNNIQFVHQAPTSCFYFSSNSSVYPSVPSSSSSISIIPESASIFSIPTTKTIAEGGNNSNDKVKNRQIKNRESALLSRKRKQDEMSYLHSKVNSLEEEIQRLKSRLIMYEGGNNNDTTTMSSDSMHMMSGVGVGISNGGGVVVVSDSASCIDSDSVSVSSTDSCADNNMKNTIPNHRRQRYQQQVRPVQNNNNRHLNVKNIISNPISYGYTNNGVNSNNSNDVSNKTSNNNNNNSINNNMKMNYNNNNKCGSGVSNLEPAEFYHLF